MEKDLGPSVSSFQREILGVRAAKEKRRPYGGPCHSDLPSEGLGDQFRPHTCWLSSVSVQGSCWANPAASQEAQTPRR